MSGARLAQKSSIFICACSGGGKATVAPISRRGHTPSSPAKGRHACRHPHSSGLEWGLWAPEAPGIPTLLSRMGPARVRQPGGHHLDNPGLPCDPTSLPPGDPNIRQLHKEKPTVGPALGHSRSPWPVRGQGSPGTHRTGAAHTGPEGCWAKATPHVRWAWSSTPVLRGRQPSACLCHSLATSWCPRALSLCGRAALCLVASPPHGPALPVSLTCHDLNSPNGFSPGPFSVSSCLSRVIPEWQLR